MFAPPIAKAQSKAAANSTSKQAPKHSTHVARPFSWGMIEQAHMLQGALAIRQRSGCWPSDQRALRGMNPTARMNKKPKWRV
jgi:hypothetical protein